MSKGVYCVVEKRGGRLVDSNNRKVFDNVDSAKRSMRGLYGRDRGINHRYTKGTLEVRKFVMTDDVIS